MFFLNKNYVLRTCNLQVETNFYHIYFSIKHEHVRGDRDELLHIDIQQISEELPGFEYNFYKIQTEDWGQAPWPFDFRSVMNYPSKIGNKVSFLSFLFLENLMILSLVVHTLICGHF